MNTSEDLRVRFDLVTAAAEPVPEDVSAWKDYLEGTVENLDRDPGTVLGEGNSAEVFSAGDALPEHYTDTCMD